MSASDVTGGGGSPVGSGPDIVIAGAARSGTSFLSATLARHSRVDASAVKEPNYFSSKWTKGAAWYESQFAPRMDGILRLDSSVSYTYPQHPDALVRLCAASPKAKVIYAVRSPIPRLVSMYQLFRYYAAPDMFGSLGEAIDKSDMCLLSGDYGLWIDRIRNLFPAEQILVVPFPLLTAAVSSGLEVLLPWLGLSPEAELVAAETSNYRNEVRQFRWKSVSRAQRVMHKSKLYPIVRSAVGPDRLRTLRRLATRQASIPSAVDEVATLTVDQRRRVDEASQHATAAVTQWLQEQDVRIGTAWTPIWARHVGEPLR